MSIYRYLYLMVPCWVNQSTKQQLVELLILNKNHDYSLNDRLDHIKEWDISWIILSRREWKFGMKFIKYKFLLNCNGEGWLISTSWMKLLLIFNEPVLDNVVYNENKTNALDYMSWANLR